MQTMEMHFLFYFTVSYPRQHGNLLDVVAAVDGVIYLLPAIGQLWEEEETRQGKWSQFMLRAEEGR